MSELPGGRGVGPDGLPLQLPAAAAAEASTTARADRQRGRRVRRESALRELLRITAFRRLWAAVAISSLGDWLGLLAMTALAQQLTRGQSIATQGAAISGVILVRLLPDLLFGALAGAIADRMDRRVTVVVGELVAGALYLTVALSYDLTVLYIAQFVIEAVGLFTMASKQALWVGSVPKERLPLANQLSLTSVYGAVPIAALIFAALSTISRFFNESGTAPAEADVRFAIVAALCINVASYVISATTVFLTRHQLAAHAADREEQVGIWSLIREGVAFVGTNPLIRKLYVGILGAFAAGGFTVGVAQLYVTSLAAGTAGYSILFGTVFTGLAVGMVVGPRIFPTLSRRRIFGTSIATSGVFLVGMALVRDFVLATILAAGVGLAAGIAWIIGYTLIGQEVEDRLRGRTFAFVVSSVRIMLLLTVALGPLLAGLLSPKRDDVGRSAYTVDIGSVELVFSGPGLTLLIAGLLALVIGGYAGRSVAHEPVTLRDLLARVLGRGDELINVEVRGGLFIVVEGADQTFAAEQADALAAALAEQGIAVTAVHEPSDTSPGRRTRELVERVAAGTLAEAGLEPETIVLLASADRSEQTAKVIRPALDRGEVVVSDGYVDTTVAFFGGPEGADPERIIRVSSWSTDGLRPDLTVVLDGAVGGPLERVRRAFIDRAGAEVTGYEIVRVGDPGDGVHPAVLQHATSLIRDRRDQLRVAEPAT